MKKGFILPMVVLTMLLFSIFSLLLLTFVTSTTLTSRLMTSSVNEKMFFEKVYLDLKNGDVNENIDSYNEDYTVKLLDAFDKDEFEPNENEVVLGNISAVIIEKDEKIVFFAIFDTDENKTINFQMKNFDFEFDNENSFEYKDFVFRESAT